MSASIRPLALYDLLAPQFFLGFNFPDYIDKYLSLLAVSDLQTSSDDNAVLYTGTVYFPSADGSTPVLPQHVDPSGAIFDFHDFSFRFRLLVPREGAIVVQDALNAIPSAVFPSGLQPLKDDVFGTVGSPAGVTDYPGEAFQLELILNLLTFHLGPNWEPAIQNADFSISPDPGSPPNTDVRVLLPQVLLRYTQGPDFVFQGPSPSIDLVAWGDPGFDAPNDLAEGQLATMVPPLAIHSSGRVAFGVDTIVLDLSSNGAPPEILQFFGTDENFKGLYIKKIQVYYTDSNKDFALNFAVRDALISFAGKIWLDAELDLIFDAFTVTVTAWDGSTPITVNPGSQINPSTYSGGSLTIPSSGVIYLQIAGGIPPYTQSVVFTPGPASPPSSGGPQLWNSAANLATAPNPISGAQESGTLLVTVTDSTKPTPLKYSNALAITVTNSAGSNGTPPAPPAPPSNPKPSTIRRLSIQVRLEENTVVLAEVSGEVDFASQMQSAVPGGSPPTSSNSLGINGTPAATTSASPVGGIVDFTLNVTYDLATGDLTETVTLGAVPADANGLLHMDNSSDNMLKDILGAICIFTPILNAATTALDPSQAGQWAEIGVDLGVPVAIAALDIIQTTGITLYGGSLQLRENIPEGKVTNASLTFDYGVQFKIEIDLLNIHSTKPLSVRYQAVGISLHFGNPAKFQMVLDTSKGYSLDLSDPGLFNLPGGLGDLLKIAGARIARFNPVTLEVDIEIKADLGIITVDKFMIKVPFDGSSAPSFTPSGVKVNIPDTITGSGIVTINDGGFEGDIDITICPISMRMVASIGVQHVSQGDRQATAFYFGFELDFPAPITLGTTGLALFGIFGLFGMHYDRVLSAPIPGDAVGPDLRWLVSTKGQPYLIESEDGSVQFWGPKIDNWAFGVGAMVGTEDGFLVTMRGMLILELPGPRIIITVNVNILAEMPGASDDDMDTSDLEVGIIGILDIDVGAGQITLGVMIDLEETDLISIQIPVQLYFSWVDPSTWHFWIGTIQTPASAKILGIVRGGGYFMIGGQAIQPFPPGSSGTLPGVAVAMGISASVIWGSQSDNLYLKVVAAADFGVSFAPTLFIVGDVHLEGALHLFIVDISATGDFELKAPNPVYLQVHVCGSVSLLFFSVSACVEFSIGSDSTPGLPPALISNLYLQSFAPVIAQGQGTRPIDSSLGNAVLVGGSGALPVVPIDSVPVIQMLYGVDVSAVSSTFTQPLPTCPTYPGTPGVNLGGGRSVQYQITQLTISPALPTGFPAPPVAWRPNKPASNTAQTLVDLALFSRNPNVTTSALERSSQLTGQLQATWGGTCTAVAPAAAVLYTFCSQPLGPLPSGWLLNGVAYPDPNGTSRTSAVPTQMQVVQPELTAAEDLLLRLILPVFGTGFAPAKVVGLDLGRIIPDPPCYRAVELPELITSPVAGGAAAALTRDAAPTEVRAAVDQPPYGRWLRFDTGGSQRVRLMMAVNGALYKEASTSADQSWLLINEIDANGNRIATHPLPSLHPKVLTPANFGTTLPSTWVDMTGPWFKDVVSILEYFFGLGGSVAIFIEFTPGSSTVMVETEVTAPSGNMAVMVGVIESLPTSETVRYGTGVSIQTSTIETITEYLDGGAPVPLLEPDTVYTITMAYDAIDTEPGSTNTTTTSYTQSYQFRTDASPPSTLTPYVLCSSPAQSDTYVFYEDPLDIVFNDSSVFTLFSAYGYELSFDLHAADGLPEGSPSGGVPLTGSPSSLQAIDGVGTATYDAMLALAQELPCISGTLSAYQNQIYTAPVALRPLMGYTFDLVSDPPMPSAGSAGSPLVAVTPLFRLSFTTGRYANLQSLAAAFAPAAAKIVHRTLTSALSFPASGGTPVYNDADAQIYKDADIEQAFVDAGEQHLAAPVSNSIVLYWLASQGGYVPHAILIDSIEPLWRYRSEPGFTLPMSSDPSFKIVTINSVPSLEVEELIGSPGTPAIGSFIVSPGGGRTVALFAPGFTAAAAGTPVTLQLYRAASAVYGNGDETALIAELLITAQAPWEGDHV
jgi:hypothetical protein